MSEIIVTPHCTVFSGPDAIALYRAKALRNAIALHQRTGIIPTRGVTITRLLKEAASFSQKHYRRGEHQRAIDDLTQWITAMEAALPIIKED